MPRVIRKIRWFRRDNDELVGEADLRGISLRQLGRLFDRPADDPMYDCSPVTATHVADLQRYVDHPIRLDRYDYFVEADALPTRAQSSPVARRNVA